jgi:hypothetical protein
MLPSQNSNEIKGRMLRVLARCEQPGKSRLQAQQLAPKLMCDIPDEMSHISR